MQNAITGSSMAQNGPFIKFMGFDTRRKQIHIYFY